MTLAKLVKTVVAALDEIKARDIEVLDVTKMTDLFDRMIIASGDSTRQTKAIASNVQEKVKAGGGAVYGMEGGETGEWVLVDLGNVLVHVMQTTVRAHYNLEELWAEAKKVSKTTVDASRNKPSIKPRIVKPRGVSAKSTSIPPKKSKSSKRGPAGEQ
jgi:ribosome-associated protein